MQACRSLYLFYMSISKEAFVLVKKHDWQDGFFIEPEKVQNKRCIVSEIECHFPDLKGREDYCFTLKTPEDIRKQIYVDKKHWEAVRNTIQSNRTPEEKDIESRPFISLSEEEQQLKKSRKGSKKMAYQKKMRV